MNVVFSAEGYALLANDGRPVLERSNVALCPAQGDRYVVCSGPGEAVRDGRTWPSTRERPRVTLRTSVLDSEAALLQVVVANEGDTDLLVRAICPVFEAHLSWAPQEHSLRVLPDGWERLYGEAAPKDIELLTRVLSPWHLLLWNRTEGRALMAGFHSVPQTLLSWEIQGSAVWKGSPRFLTAVGATLSGSQPCRLPPGKSFEMETLVFVEGEDPTEVFVRYCDLVAQANGVRVPQGRFFGVCDWYGHVGDASECFVHENLEALAGSVPQQDRGVYVVDAGWQAAWLHKSGTSCDGAPWVPNKRFASGMPALAQRIRERGMRPGLWWRPLLVSHHSPLMKKHPEWIAAETIKDGRVVEGHLDPTNPEVLAWIESEARRFVEEYDIEYLKSDFVTVDMMGYWGPDAHFGDFRREVRLMDETMTNAQAHRRLWEAVRRGVGPNTLLLGCNAMGPLALGIIDLQRIGDDTSPHHWEAQVAHGAGSVTNRFAQNRRWWVNDPDVVIANQNFTDHQARTWSGFVALTGGLMMFGDRVAALPAHRRAWLARLHELHRLVVEARPLDFMEAPLGQQWMARTADPSCPAILGVFNWEESPARLSIRRDRFFVPLGTGVSLEEFWTGAKSTLALLE